MRQIEQRMAIWLMVLTIALVCGLPLNHTTLFWVGVMSVWILASDRGSE